MIAAFTLQQEEDKVKEVTRSYLNVPFFLHFVPSPFF